MKGFIKRKVIFIGSLFLASLLFLTPFYYQTKAQGEKAGLSLSPLLYEVEANPGDGFQKEARVTNVTDKDMRVVVDVDDFVAGGEHGEPQILVGQEKGASKWSLKAWMKVSETTFDLKPKEGKYVYYTVIIPIDAEPGGHYGVVRFTSQAPNITDSSGVGIAGSVGQLVLLKVSGPVKETGQIEEFYTKVASQDKEAKKTRFFESSPVGFEIRFKNTGNVHYKPSGTIEITSVFGGKTNLAIAGANVLPESIRRFEGTWQDTPFLGIFRAKAKMTYSNMVAESPTITFFIMPWKIVLLTLVVLIAIGLLLWRQIHLSKKLKTLMNIKQKK